MEFTPTQIRAAAWAAGQVEAGAKQLFVDPLGLHYGDGELNLR